MRHNWIRDAVFEEAQRAGMRPEKEKAGLLPRRPDSDGVPTAVDLQRRRPADVWRPLGQSNKPQALDFVCSSGLRAEVISRLSSQPTAVFAEYEQVKRDFQGIHQECAAQSLQFSPVVFESHSGAWSPAARKIFDSMTQRAASTSSSAAPPEAQSLRFAQRSSVTLHRANARNRQDICRDATRRPDQRSGCRRRLIVSDCRCVCSSLLRTQFSSA